ncbi:MAG: oxygen-insensitive NAD(P)H nitroreductase [Acinetobacter sp.]
MGLLHFAQQRYSTKAYDSEKKIPQHQIDTFLEILRLSPSSINIQPWHFFVADNTAAKQRIAQALVGKYAYNAPKVLDSSHTIIFTTQTDIDSQHLQHLLERDDVIGRFKDETTKKTQAELRQGYINQYRESDEGIQQWLENQTFIALGVALTNAIALGFDTTAIGGFDAEILDKELGLSSQGLKASVILTLGYHSEQDFNAKLPKSRLEQKQLFTFL